MKQISGILLNGIREYSETKQIDYPKRRYLFDKFFLWDTSNYLREIIYSWIEFNIFGSI